MKKNLILAAIALLGLATGGYFAFLKGNTSKYDFRLDKISTGDITMVVTATGTINAVTSVDVGTQVSGIISKLYADFNSVVKAGQIIAQIDSTFLAQSVKDAEASLDKAKAQLADSKRNLDREKILLQKGLDSQLNYDAALTTNESNAANVKSAQASLDRAKINLAYATIYAPIDGVVINRAVNVGQTVAASFSSPTLFTIANDLQKMQVETTVDESDIGRISIGQEAAFTVDAYSDETFKGTISQIRLAPVTIQNVVNYTVVIDVNNEQLKLMPGMTANVKVVVASAPNALRVSNLALRFQPPADLVDSVKLRALVGNGSGRWAQSQTAGRSAGHDSSSMGADRRKQFQAIRDSIMKANGGQLSQEELRNQMAALFRKRQGVTPPPAPKMAERSIKSIKSPKFGITQRYPEYEKSAFVADHAGGRARIWVLNANGKLVPFLVHTGITDGKYTEITGSDLHPGDQIVLGASAIGSVATTQNPLTGGGQQRPGGGGGFR